MRGIARWTALMALLLPVPYLPAVGQEDGGESELKLAPLAQVVVDRYMNAVNHQDRNAYYQAHHFPVVELRGGRVTLIRSQDEVPYEIFGFLPVGWFKSRVVEQRVVQKDRNKAHVVARIEDLDRKGESLGEYETLFILTQRGGRWGIQVRSSYPIELPEGTVRAPL